ncbi:MAG: RnfABCDGE type electron transport complex subunit D [Planctomycetota bacterium]
MKWLERWFDTARPIFKRFRLHAVVDATEAVFLGPERTPDAPHVRDSLDLKRYMATAILAALPAAAAGIYLFGLHVVAMIMVSYIVGGSVEVLFAAVRKEEISEGFLVTGLYFPLICPPGLPLWMVAVGVAFGVVVGKELFGGTGRNLFNPALVGRGFLAMGYPAAMAANWIAPKASPPGRLLQYVTSASADGMASATPLGAAKAGTFHNMQDLVLGNVAGSAGETSALLIVLGGLFLMYTRVADWRVPVATLGSFLGLGYLLRFIEPGIVINPGWHMLAGGLLFGAFFMATDPISGPVSKSARWFYGLLIGSVTLMIRNFTGYVEGVTYAILLGNIFAPIFDEIVFRCHRWRLSRAE